MAQIKKNGLVVGKMGDVVYQVCNGKQILKENNRDVKLTAESKQCSTEFSAANNASANLRNGLQLYVSGMADTAMHGRFTGAIFHAIRNSHQTGEGRERVGQRTFEDANLSLLEGFEFNKNTPFSEYCTVDHELNFTDGIVRIAVNGFSKSKHLKRIPNTQGEVLLYGVAAFNPKSQGLIGSVQEFRVRGNYPDTLLEWQSEPIPQGKVVLVFAAVIYYGMPTLEGKKVLTNRQLHPCKIVAAFTS